MFLRFFMYDILMSSFYFNKCSDIFYINDNYHYICINIILNNLIHNFSDLIIIVFEQFIFGS